MCIRDSRYTPEGGGSQLLYRRMGRVIGGRKNAVARFVLRRRICSGARHGGTCLRRRGVPAASVLHRRGATESDEDVGSTNGAQTALASTGTAFGRTVEAASSPLPFSIGRGATESDEDVASTNGAQTALARTGTAFGRTVEAASSPLLFSIGAAPPKATRTVASTMGAQTTLANAGTVFGRTVDAASSPRFFSTGAAPPKATRTSLLRWRANRIGERWHCVRANRGSRIPAASLLHRRANWSMYGICATSQSWAAVSLLFCPRCHSRCSSRYARSGCDPIALRTSLARWAGGFARRGFGTALGSTLAPELWRCITFRDRSYVTTCTIILEPAMPPCGLTSCICLLYTSPS